jgi:hypothetical protein
MTTIGGAKPPNSYVHYNIFLWHTVVRHNHYRCDADRTMIQSRGYYCYYYILCTVACVVHRRERPAYVCTCVLEKEFYYIRACIMLLYVLL